MHCVSEVMYPRYVKVKYLSSLKVSVLSCWLSFSGGVSAVRTLALCCATGSALMYRPLRFGRAHGVSVV